MHKIEFQIDDALAPKFDIALQLTGKTQDEVLADLIKKFVAETFSAAADSLKDPNESNPQKPIAGAQNPRTARRAVPPPVYGQPIHNQPQQETDRSFAGEWGKAINRIPRWAKNPQQYNHKILRAFFELQQELGLGRVTLDALRKRCSDPTAFPKTFVPHFDNNFSQMKFDNGNSHGKVFEEHDGFITLWDCIHDTLMRYRDYFIK